MGLQGEFPVTIEIENEEEAWDYLMALSRQKRDCHRIAKDLEDHGLHKDAKTMMDGFNRADKLYTKILMACGDD